MIDLATLPHVNAALNGTSTVLLALGWSAILRRKRDLHRKLMLAALTSSALFLACYLVYHAGVGSVRFRGQGLVRTVYFAVLISHTVLAAAVFPAVLLTFRRALKSDFAAHRKIAQWTLPVWLYVSFTGVIVYLMLYHLPA
jgi:uncharacterized membrane protein YozB (DUF420 family)